MAQIPIVSLDLVPNEVINHLLRFVSPDDNLNGFQLVSRRFNLLANEPLLWRYYCCNTFKHWHTEHGLRDKSTASQAKWKQLYLLRTARNQHIARLFDKIIETKVNRFKSLEQICKYGYDAKDFLLEQSLLDPFAEDGLARRYFGKSILNSIHRGMAIEEWCSLQSDPDQHSTQITGVRLERALGAFDMFVLHGQPGDLYDITNMLDDNTSRFRGSHPDFDNLTTRQKALALVRWLRAKNLTGVQNPEQNYRNLRNCLIGQALRHDEHESLPIISSAIFCCIASRLGIDARCCAFPSHVHTIVYPTPGQTLDNTPLEEPDTSQRMFLDPYGNDNEVPVFDLHVALARFGWHENMDTFLAPVSTLSITMRTAQNLRATLTRILELEDHAHPELSQLMSGDNALNVEACIYSATWASLILAPTNTPEWLDRMRNFLRRFIVTWPEDAWLIEKYLWPIYARIGLQVEGGDADEPWEFWRLFRDQDGVAPRVVRRTPCGNVTNNPLKIGQVFRHRNHGWIGVVISWSDQLTLPPDFNEEMPNPRLARPGDHCFYTCLPSTGPEPRVVATYNIEPISDPSIITDGMFPNAGKYFKRFDLATCGFVSNIREQFPDD